MSYLDEFQNYKRAGNACPTDYSLCPKSLGSGCCPSTMSCGVSSCYGTMTSALAPCSRSGYVACDIQDGAGCCPSGYQCNRNGCVAPTGTSISTAVATCGTGSYLCPASLSGGCCESGLSCGLTTCYATFTSSVLLTLTTTTTDSASSVSTMTTVIQTAYIPSTPPVTSTTSSPTAVSKILASTTSANATSISTPTEGVLSSAQRGAIIGGAIAGLIIVMLLAFMAFFILRRLSKAASRASGSGSGSANDSSRHRDHSRHQSSTDSGSEHLILPAEPVAEMDENQRNVLDRPTPVYPAEDNVAHQHSPPFPSSNAIGYTPLPTSESEGSQYAIQQHSYFDQYSGSLSNNVSPPLDNRNQNSRFGYQAGTAQRRPSVASHGRNWSDVSVQSDRSQRSQESYELEGDVRRESVGTVQSALTNYRLSLSRKLGRRKNTLSTREPLEPGGDWAKSLQGKLDNVAEVQKPNKENNGGGRNIR